MDNTSIASSSVNVWKGQGIGQRLMQHVLGQAKADEPIRLDCVADNAIFK